MQYIHPCWQRLAGDYRTKVAQATLYRRRPDARLDQQKLSHRMLSFWNTSQIPFASMKILMWKGWFQVGGKALKLLAFVGDAIVDDDLSKCLRPGHNIVKCFPLAGTPRTEEEVDKYVPVMNIDVRLVFSAPGSLRRLAPLQVRNSQYKYMKKCRSCDGSYHICFEWACSQALMLRTNLADRRASSINTNRKKQSFEASSRMHYMKAN